MPGSWVVIGTCACGGTGRFLASLATARAADSVLFGRNTNTPNMAEHADCQCNSFLHNLQLADNHGKMLWAFAVLFFHNL